MLKFSRKIEYALIALVYMSNKKTDELTTARELSEKFLISLELMGKIMQSLARKNLIKSVQGVKGGYFIARPAEKIRLSEIMSAIDGPLRLVNCENKDRKPCERVEFCIIRRSMLNIQQNILDYFSSVTLKNFKEQLSTENLPQRRQGGSEWQQHHQQ